MNNLKNLTETSQVTGTVRLFSVRNEFPNEWQKFKATVINGDAPFVQLTLPLKEEHYPFWSKGLLNAVTEVNLYARSAKNKITLRQTAGDDAHEDTLVATNTFGNLKTGKFDKIPKPNPLGNLSLFMDDNSMTDLWIALKWGS